MPKSMHVLIVDDHESTRETIKDVVETDGVTGHTAKDVAEAIRELERREFDLVITDLRLPDRSGMNVLERAKALYPDTPVVMITGFGSEQTAVDAMKKGATDYLSKPLNLHRMRTVIDNALNIRRLSLDNRTLKQELAQRRSLSEVIGNSPAMRKIKDLVKQVAPTNATILLTGESGVGKEVIVDAIQSASDRAGKPYIKINTAALPRDLLESELFGHEKGAFTGAIKQKKGRFELADGGTLFLDEIGEMPIETQVKLLRVLQEQSFERVGGVETLKTDVRLVCATNQDLEKAMAEGRFRQDLYYRINVIKIDLPPLRQRREDIVPLVNHFIRMYGAHRNTPSNISSDAMAVLTNYSWPGNIRELENVIQRAFLLCNCDIIDVQHLPEEVVSKAAGDIMRNASDASPHDAAQSQSPTGQGMLFTHYRTGRRLEDIEKMYIYQTLQELNWNKTQAAKQLDIGLKTLYRKIEKFGLKPNTPPE